MLNVSIVIYNHSFSFIEKLLREVQKASSVANIFIMDNSKCHSLEFSELANVSMHLKNEDLEKDGNSQTEVENFYKLRYIFNNKNLGYGAGHNVAIRFSMGENEGVAINAGVIEDSGSTLEINESIDKGVGVNKGFIVQMDSETTDYHLVLNPDIELKADDIDSMVKFMDENPDIGHLMPKVLNPDGSIQYLCKQLPSPFDLIIRRFFPDNWFTKRRDWFEMRDSGYDKIMDVPYLSGSIMLLRVKALREVGIFDERFFMYPEDIDLTRRIGEKYRTVFYPEVSVIHHHEKASFKSLKMLWIHIWNITKYFMKWGFND